MVNYTDYKSDLPNDTKFCPKLETRTLRMWEMILAYKRNYLD